MTLKMTNDHITAVEHRFPRQETSKRRIEVQRRFIIGFQRTMHLFAKHVVQLVKMLVLPRQKIHYLGLKFI